MRTGTTCEYPQCLPYKGFDGFFNGKYPKDHHQPGGSNLLRGIKLVGGHAAPAS